MVIANHSERAKGKQKATQPAEATSKRRRKNSEDWAYKPPPGAVLLDAAEDAGDFDWDSLKTSEDTELWIIRVPEGIKPKALDGLKVDVPSSSQTARIGSAKHRHVHYDIWSLGKEQTDQVGGQEIKNVSCLLPRPEKGGKLYLAPSSIPTRHLVFSAIPALPTPDSSETSDPSDSFTNPPRPTYPKEFLKHRFMPYGSLAHPANGDSHLDDMEVDNAGDSQALPAPQPPEPPAGRKSPKKKSDKEEEVKVKEAKVKKRKVEEASVASPKKKSKKPKGSD